MRVVVTGGTGFTGQFVLRALSARGIAATALVRPGSDRSIVDETGSRAVEGDLRDPASLVRCFRGHDCLVNVASIGHGQAPDIVRCAVVAGITRAVFASTTAILTRLPVRSRPVREAAEAAIRESPLRWTILRPTMIYGTSRDRNVCRLLHWLRRWGVMGLPSGGHALQQPVHVEDVASAMVASLMTSATAGGTYSISGLLPITFREMVQESARAVGVTPMLVPFPLAPAAAIAGLAERLRIPMPVRAEQLRRIAEDKAFAHIDAARDFGFSPRPFSVGVRQEAESLGLAATQPQAPHLPSRG